MINSDPNKQFALTAYLCQDYLFINTESFITAIQDWTTKVYKKIILGEQLDQWPYHQKEEYFVGVPSTNLSGQSPNNSTVKTVS